MRHAPRILLIDPDDHARRVLSDRLVLQGFEVFGCRDGAEGAVRALEHPPSAIVADLSMPSISGVQLCRLLRAEAGTANVAVILRGPDGRRNHFWAEQAGAFAYVVKGRMGELVRTLRRALDHSDDAAVLSTESTDGLDVRDRIAAHLDAALFDSVIAAEIRRLGTSESFERLFDSLSQFLSQVTSYRWMAVHTTCPTRLGIHVNSACRSDGTREAQAVFGVTGDVALFTVEDDDAVADVTGPDPLSAPMFFGDSPVGAIAMAARAPAHPRDATLVRTIARELGAAVRMANLVEETRHLATIDAVTGLLNRRAFLEWIDREMRRVTRYGDALSLVMIDIDHFKQINDHHGHAAGDLVLGALGALVTKALRDCDVVARWGGEEFVLALPSTALEGAVKVAERLRADIEASKLLDGRGCRVRVTASLGVAQFDAGESIARFADRADRAMYAAKNAGRNRVVTWEPRTTDEQLDWPTAGAEVRRAA